MSALVRVRVPPVATRLSRDEGPMEAGEDVQMYGANKGNAAPKRDRSHAFAASAEAAYKR